MERISRFGAIVALLFALIFLRTCIVNHVESGSIEVVPPNNYFIGLGTLFAGMGVVMFVIDLKSKDPNRSWIINE